MGEAECGRHDVPDNQDDPLQGSKIFSLPNLPGGLRSEQREGRDRRLPDRPRPGILCPRPQLPETWQAGARQEHAGRGEWSSQIN